MTFVVRGIDQRDTALARQISKMLEFFRVTFDFVPVAAAELIPFAGIVTEPLAKFRAGRELFQPLVDAGGSLGITSIAAAAGNARAEGVA